MNKKPRNQPKTNNHMLVLQQPHVRQGTREDVGAADKARAMRARVIQHMERVEYAHEM